jgi:DNA invertase Pin-like site-specific DNA recombinase
MKTQTRAERARIERNILGERTNEQREAAGEEAIRARFRLINPRCLDLTDDEIEEQAVDTVTDILHYCVSARIRKWRDIARMAVMHVEEERGL